MMSREVWYLYIKFEGIVQDCNYSIAKALEL